MTELEGGCGGILGAGVTAAAVGVAEAWRVHGEIPAAGRGYDGSMGAGVAD